MLCLFAFGFALLGMPGCAPEDSAKTKNAKPVLMLASEGKTDYIIVKPEKTSASEERAVKELAESLKRITGATFAVQAESGAQPAKAIYVGATVFASAQGIDLAKFEPEEWLVRVVGDNLMITGGLPRGAEYGVYEFLETQAGMYVLSDEAEVVPSAATFAIPALNERGSPAFYYHCQYSPRHFKGDAAAKERDQRFLRWNRESSIDAFEKVDCHTFGKYIPAAEFAQTHPEYLGMGLDGKWMTDSRGHTRSFFQLCATNPEVRNLVADRMLEEIRKDREEAEKAGSRPRIFYELSQNDCTDCICACPRCKELAEREGGQAGLLLDFINDIAARIEREFSDVIIQTFAYNFTLDPPKTIKPRRNVMMRWCDNYGRAECVRPFTHPMNKELRDSFDSWQRISSHLAFWDYMWYRKPHPPGFYAPSSNINALQPDLQYLRANKAESLFLENEDFGGGGVPTDSWGPDDVSSFSALRVWLIYKLMQNPERPVAPLLDVFFKGYYGAAAKPMREYLDYVERRQRECKLRIIDLDRVDLHKAYLDLDFFLKVEKIFNAAEAACVGDAAMLSRVAHERIPVDSALLWLEPSLAKAGKPFPFEREKILKRYAENWERWITVSFSPEAQAEVRPFVKKRIDMLESTSSRAEKYLKLKPLPVAPKMDGIVSEDAAWKDAAQVPLMLSNGMGAPRMATIARIGLLGETLYVAFECTEDRLSDMIAQVKTPGGNVWEDDCVEIFIDPGLTRKEYRQVVVNSIGTILVGGTDKSWKPQVEAKTVIDTELRRWTVEVAIPVNGMKLAPRFGLNFGRERRPVGQPLELSTWSVTDGGFCNPYSFGLATLDGVITLATFDKDSDGAAFTSENGAKCELTRSSGEGALLINLPRAENSYPGVKLHAEQADWSVFKAVRFDVFLEGETPARLGLRLDAGKGKGKAAFGSYELKPGWNRQLVFMLDEAGKKADLSRMQTLLFYLGKPTREVTLRLDEINLILP
jgi:hypothetical protein